MKKIKTFHIISILVIGLMITISSCKKSEPTTPTPAAGSLMFHLHTDVDTSEVANYGDTLVLTGGRRIAVTMAQFYISGIQVEQTNGTWIAGPSSNMLKVQETEPYLLGSVASGNYMSVRFNIGLSVATNASTPSSSDPTLYRKDMWFDSTMAMPNNFVFVDFEGRIDTATTPSAGNALIPFVYRIGTNANLRTVTLPPQNFTVFPNQPSMVHMIADYAKLFTGVQLNVSSNLSIKTAADNSMPVATQIANNIPGMIHYE